MREGDKYNSLGIAEAIEWIWFVVILQIQIRGGSGYRSLRRDEGR